MKRLLLATVVSLLTATSAMAQTVYIVRHAEKADASSDPVLSAAGEARARALARLMSGDRPDFIITSPLRRTVLTGQPTAMERSLPMEAIDFEGGVEGHVGRIVAQVRDLKPDQTVLIVGHSNTVPLIARALGYAEAADMPECEFDRMTVLHLTGDGAHGQVSRYGAPSTCPAE
jgi:broad specificity phosphatase PhoE